MKLSGFKKTSELTAKQRRVLQNADYSFDFASNRPSAMFWSVERLSNHIARISPPTELLRAEDVERRFGSNPKDYGEYFDKIALILDRSDRNWSDLPLYPIDIAKSIVQSVPAMNTVYQAIEKIKADKQAEITRSQEESRLKALKRVEESKALTNRLQLPTAAFDMERTAWYACHSHIFVRIANSHNANIILNCALKAGARIRKKRKGNYPIILGDNPAHALKVLDRFEALYDERLSLLIQPERKLV